MRAAKRIDVLEGKIRELEAHIVTLQRGQKMEVSEGGSVSTNELGFWLGRNPPSVQLSDLVSMMLDHLKLEVTTEGAKDRTFGISKKPKDKS